jgi:hypothetical protein
VFKKLGTKQNENQGRDTCRMNLDELTALRRSAVAYRDLTPL